MNFLAKDGSMRCKVLPLIASIPMLVANIGLSAFQLKASQDYLKESKNLYTEYFFHPRCKIVVQRIRDSKNLTIPAPRKLDLEGTVIIVCEEIMDGQKIIGGEEIMGG